MGGARLLALGTLSRVASEVMAKKTVLGEAPPRTEDHYYHWNHVHAVLSTAHDIARAVPSCTGKCVVAKLFLILSIYWVYGVPFVVAFGAGW